MKANFYHHFNSIGKSNIYPNYMKVAINKLISHCSALRAKHPNRHNNTGKNRFSDFLGEIRQHEEIEPNFVNFQKFRCYSSRTWSNNTSRGIWSSRHFQLS